MSCDTEFLAQTLTYASIFFDLTCCLSRRWIKSFRKFHCAQQQCGHLQLGHSLIAQKMLPHYHPSCGLSSSTRLFNTRSLLWLSPIILQARVPAHLCTSPIPMKLVEGSDETAEPPGSGVAPGSRRKKRRRKRARSDRRDDDDSSSSEPPDQEEESVLAARSEVILIIH